MKVHLDNAVAGLSDKQRRATSSAGARLGLARAMGLVYSAGAALSCGDRAAAERLLTEAADVEFGVTGDAEAIGPLFEALGLEDGVAERVERFARHR